MDSNIKNPKVTVFMPVYNGEKYLKESIESILSQTFRDFELLIVNDGSRDGSEKIIKDFKDDRIRYIKNKENLGVVKTRNVGIKESRGTYLALMDQDDISLPRRLDIQVKFMDDNLDIGISGTWTKTIGNNAGTIGKFLTDPEEIHANLLFFTSVAHSSVIMRRNLLINNNLEYSDVLEIWEDYGLWTRAVKITKISNIPKVLLKYRRHETNITKTLAGDINEASKNIKLKQLKEMGITPNEEEFKAHLFFFRPTKELINIEFTNTVESWFKKIKEQNGVVQVYKQQALERVLAINWLIACHASSNLGFKIWKRFWSSQLSKNISIRKDHREILKFLARCLIKRHD